MTDVQLTTPMQAKAWVQADAERFNALKPSGINGERWLEIICLEITQNPNLQACTPQSIFSAALQAAQLGLEFGSALQQAYLVPFNRKDKATGKFEKRCELIVSFRGLIKMIKQADPNITVIEARTVYENDRFSVDDTKLVHGYEPFGDRGPCVGAYARIFYLNGAQAYETMSIEDIEKIQKMSKAGAYGPWKDHWESMARKTVIRRLAKYVVQNPNLNEQLTRLEDAEFEIVNNVPASAAQPVGVSATLAAMQASENAPQVEFEPVAEPTEVVVEETPLDGS